MVVYGNIFIYIFLTDLQGCLGTLHPLSMHSHKGHNLSLVIVSISLMSAGSFSQQTVHQASRKEFCIWHTIPTKSVLFAYE